MTRLGETFHGIINGVVPKGIFVEIEENKEGLCPRMAYRMTITYTMRTGKP